MVLIHYDYFNETKSFGKDRINYVISKPAPGADRDVYARTIDALFEGAADITSTDTEQAFSRAFLAQFGNIALVACLVAGAAITVTILIAGTTMMMAIRERTSEIGVPMTPGFGRRRIFLLVIGESLLVAVFAGCAGLPVAVAGIEALGPQCLARATQNACQDAEHPLRRQAGPGSRANLGAGRRRCRAALRRQLLAGRRRQSAGDAGGAVLLAQIAGMMIVAAQQHALLVIMHDATHVRLVAGKSYNDPVANWFCAFPAGLVTSLYRRGHLVHHSFANMMLDPYFTQMQAREHFKAPMPRGRFRSLPPGDAFGLHLKEWGDFVRPWRGWSFLFARQDGNWLSRNERIAFGLFWLAVLASVAAAGQMLYFIAIWIVPSLTFPLLFARVRIVAEHRSGHSRDELKRTRMSMRFSGNGV